MRMERMTSADIDAVYDMSLEIFPDEPWPRDRYIDIANDPDAYFFIAYWGDDMAGYCGMYHNTSLHPPYCKITTLGVGAKFRRRGIAKTLMTKVLGLARQLGLSRAKLEVHTENSGAIRLYESLGFKTETTEKDYYSYGDAYIMWRYEED